MNSRTHKTEKARHIYRLLFSAVLILAEAALFFVIWKHFYNPALRVPYRFKGNYFVTFIYALLLLVFGNLYGGLKLGYYRTFHILFSLAVSSLVTNLVAYVAIIIPAATWYLSPLPAVGLLTLLQILCAAVWSIIGTRLFLKLFPPQRLILLYGSRTDELAAKFATRTDRYIIEEKCCVEGDNAFGPKTFSQTCRQLCRYDGVIIGDISAELRNDYLKFCYSHFLRTYTIPKLTDILLKSGETLHIFDSPIYLNRNYGLSIEQEALKRCLDLAVTVPALILCSPILLLTALAIKLEDGGPVFFRQQRCTKDGRIFSILKFRSMIVDAEKDGRVIPATDKDPRITRVGSFIRATRIDELPQLLNILKGDMALVGPRPERVEHVRQYSEEIPEFSYRMLVKGGLTGYAQVYGKYNTTAYDKLKLDLMYIQNYSILLDLEILFKTIQIVLTKESTEGFSTAASEEIREKAEGGEMKILMVNASSNIEKRVDLLYDFLQAQGHEVTVFASDYLHASKTKRSSTERGYRLIETLPYRRNISLQRLYSHWRFSRDVFREIREMSADLLYLVVPQNSNAAIAGAYRKRHPEARIIIDIVDMWPESLPIGGTDRFPFSLWAAVRDRHLHDADLVLLECDYYRERLGRRLDGIQNMTLPWLRQHTEWTSRYRDEDNVGAPEAAASARSTLRLCYLGAVNNIIDMDAVEALLKSLRAAGCAVTLELIAVGERKMELVQRAQAVGAAVTDHGPIYDVRRLQEIMDSCDYGINLMKSTVCVGLSMKLVDYLAAGLPVINSLPSDSRALMETEHCGLQWPTDAETVRRARFDRKRIRQVYEERFSSRQLARYWQEVEERL